MVTCARTHTHTHMHTRTHVMTRSIPHAHTPFHTPPQLGATVLTMSDSTGYVIEPNGFTREALDQVRAAFVRVIAAHVCERVVTPLPPLQPPATPRPDTHTHIITTPNRSFTSRAAAAHRCASTSRAPAASLWRARAPGTPASPPTWPCPAPPRWVHAVASHALWVSFY